MQPSNIGLQIRKCCGLEAKHLIMYTVSTKTVYKIHEKALNKILFKNTIYIDYKNNKSILNHNNFLNLKTKTFQTHFNSQTLHKQH